MQHEQIGRRRSGRPVYNTVNTVIYVYEAHGLTMRIHVPKGFTHDFASIPRPFNYLLPPNGPWARAAVIHDRLCATGCPRHLADAIFLHVMEQDGVKLRYMFYYVVRIHWILIGWWWKRYFRR